ncbi:hypothetical protein SERLA73DRAFT_115779 [Serpula lacrymans var. lacrymans S7.3]|uniref:P-loop containing nucleoside triphosphate hydrolase protein n=1 Tax=Serpula lacrymans var. lacrymans (strain S7.3) TaxID=936435 RepID=F8QDR6_SERL3|nr:hypothetical protein SERLA73DRAFT_115779 [Serpula lacrymans var. lacrymans S7.3]
MAPPPDRPSSSHSSTRHPLSESPFSRRAGKSSRGKNRASTNRRPEFEGVLYDRQYIFDKHQADSVGRPLIKQAHEENPKSPVSNFVIGKFGSSPKYETVEGIHRETSQRIYRTSLTLETDPPIVAIGDDTEKKLSERLAALSALYQLHDQGFVRIYSPVPVAPPPAALNEVTLSDSSVVGYERARNFMDYYCRRYSFPKPDLDFEECKGKRGNFWEATITVDGRRIGMGSAPSKKQSQVQCYLDVTQYLEKCDPDLWLAFADAEKTGKDLGMGPKVLFKMGRRLSDEISDLCRDIKKTALYRSTPNVESGSGGIRSSTSSISSRAPSYPRAIPAGVLALKSTQLLERRQKYLSDPAMENLRNTRMSLPIYTRSKELLSHIQDNEVTICMAATGSGKTTQIPQLILDDYIDREQGARCNIICTQPRRLAALSVADRVAKERGEVVGKGSIGYSVRFESKVPEEHGCVTFCTTGVLLKRLQSALTEGGLAAAKMDEVTHIVVDEVHERDVDTDLLLVVLKQMLEDRKSRNVPLKIVLMSATIDPSLFQKYFPTEQGNPADVIEVPGRLFPVTKHFLEDFIPSMKSNPRTGWVFHEDSVVKYLRNEDMYALDGKGSKQMVSPSSRGVDEDLELPYPLIALAISHVLQKTDSGHVLVFLPGWEEITAVQRILLSGRMDLNFSDSSKYGLHLLHSTIPLAEQQVIFEPPPEGVRRIILATNIAETSITIPDVVYVIDSGKVKEQRYNPDKHMTSLVSAWVGSSNLNQRAGRAGRHRSGEYFGILGKAHAAGLHPHQTVEMKRVDLTNVVMHVKALNFPGMEVEDVLAATIEPPESERVAAAMKDLQMVGALDGKKNLTPLGRVLLQLPVDVQMGRLVLYGSFFRCLDQALTLAAILTNRDPFVSPVHLHEEAAKAKARWLPADFRSDALTILQAYNTWWAMQSKGEYNSANRFCSENFLSKPTLLLISKIRGHLLQSMYQAGVIDVSAGGSVTAPTRRREPAVPPELNANGESLPLLAALIAVASQPKFAIRQGERSYRTAQDKTTFIHPSSVNHRKRLLQNPEIASQGEKQLYAFTEKRQNLSMAGSSSTPSMYLITTTRLDPMTYMLFGAYEIQVTERGLECDGWLPIVGDLDTLDDIQRLKTLMESCMLRVFEGIVVGQRHRRGQQPIPSYEESETTDEDFSSNQGNPLSSQELKDLDLLTRDIVRVLNQYSDERTESQSRQNSRPGTPMGSPSFNSMRLSGRSTPYSSWTGSSEQSSLPATPMGSPSFSSIRLPLIGSRSGYSTPHSIYTSRPSTPSGLSRKP